MNNVDECKDNRCGLLYQNTIEKKRNYMQINEFIQKQLRNAYKLVLYRYY